MFISLIFIEISLPIIIAFPIQGGAGINIIDNTIIYDFYYIPFFIITFY